MSMMGELKFFLGFQVRQLAKGTFISQEKYVKDMLKKFNMTNASPMKTPMPVKGQLGSCDGEKDVDIKAAPASALVRRRERHALLDLPLRHDTPKAPSMRPPAGSSEPANKRRHEPSMVSSSSSVKPKKGAAKFFKSLFQMCKHSYDVNSKALRLAQSNRELIIEDFRARGLELPEDPPEMAPIAHFNYRMPPLDDAMFAGYSGADIQEEEEETSEES
ncbi:hypothetical protein QYE76_028140 [Lolium multiflorum]|uniref:Reverse transcriptase Ty1/copia-type domain-containing protein n=1 Tax=Lolium multiflorum TaxID=4521 RepID=A0AAD8QN49_LOLMU|nr:hypothetical protein QYE76_028140 [Lolium multiflorum]